MSHDVTTTANQQRSAEDQQLDALLRRLATLETGLREELAAQVRRAERAEAELATAEAHAATDSIRTSVRNDSTPAISTTDRTAFSDVLGELRSSLERHRALDVQMVALAREAVQAAGERDGPTPSPPAAEASPAAASPTDGHASHEGDDDPGEDEQPAADQPEAGGSEVT